MSLHRFIYINSNQQLATISFLSLLLCLAVTAMSQELPSGWTAAPFESCDKQPWRLHPPGPPEILGRQFTAYSVRPARDARVAGASAQWDFVAASGTHEALLELSELPSSMDGLSCWIKNPNAHPLQFSLRVTDSIGTTADTSGHALVEALRWTRYVFPLTELRDSSDTVLRPPLTHIQIVIAGFLPELPITLYLDEIETLTAPLPELTVTDVEAPVNAMAGQNLTSQWVITAATGVARTIHFTGILERDGSPVTLADGKCLAETLTSGALVPLTLTMHLPQHMAGGTYRLRLTSDQARFSEQPRREVQITGQTEPSRAETRVAAESGAFVVAGRALPVVGGWHTTRHPSMSAAWVLVHLTADCTPDGRPLGTWKGPGQYDFQAAETMLARVMANNPEAFLLPVIHLEAPEWWKASHPKELMVFSHGKPELPVSVRSITRTHASWASRVWREDCGAFLAQFVQHLETGPLGPAIMGYQLAAGEGGYWAYPGASQGIYADYSIPQQEAFREWLKRRYDNLPALRAAWSQPVSPINTPEALKESKAIMGWSQASIPSEEMRSQGTQGVLHDPNGSQEVVDYQLFASDLVVETLRRFAAVADKACAGIKVIGAEYGLIWDLAATPCGLQNGGHLALTPLHEAAELDFIVSAGTAGAKDGPPFITTAMSSLARRGKLWLGTAAVDQGLGAAALPLCAGGVLAQEGFTVERWPERLNTLLSGARRGSVSEIAVVIDDVSAAYLGCGGELSRPLLSEQRIGLSLIGAPCDVWLLEDIIADRAPRYKLYVFLNAFYLDADSRKDLVSILQAEPCTALWVYCAGGIDQAVGGRSMKELTGFTLVQRRDAGPVRVKVAGDPGYTYGAAEPFKPRFICADEQADVRGELVGDGMAGLAAKSLGNLRSIWSGAPALPASLLRSLAEEAGVWLYATKNDGIYACEDLLLVRAATAEQRVRLRQSSDVYDLRSGKLLVKQVSEFQPGLLPGEVGLYYLAQP